MGAGAVLHSTGTVHMEALGGLIRRMPRTATCVLLGSLAIAAMPPLAGFVSEWLLFQVLLQSFQVPRPGLNLVFLLGLGALALTGGLAVACFVRAFGIVYLAQPRSDAAAGAQALVKLWPGGGWPRKALEALWTPAVELLLGKRRIIELYLNVVETGRGTFGVEAAARRYYRKSAAALSTREAAAIAAILPNPREWSPERGYAAERVPVLLRRMRNVAPLATCVTG